MIKNDRKKTKIRFSKETVRALELSELALKAVAGAASIPDCAKTSECTQ